MQLSLQLALMISHAITKQRPYNPLDLDALSFSADDWAVQTPRQTCLGIPIVDDDVRGTANIILQMHTEHV